MKSSTAGEDIGYNNTNRTVKTLNRVPSSSKSSSTPSSSPSPFSPLNHYTQKSKTMEEVWKDITSLHDHPSTDQELSRLHNHHHNPNFILQDFFARPTRIVSTTATHVDNTACTTTNPYASSTTVPPPPPPTVLSLNSSGPAFDFLDNSDDPLIRPNSHDLPCNLVSNVSSFTSPFEGLDTSSCLPSFGKKRVQESDNSSSDRRHKRMIKNRESAARSRARKQAYTNELELEVAHLLEENARLKRQQEELYLAAAAQLPKKNTLHRTSTAPF